MLGIIMIYDKYPVTTQPRIRLLSLNEMGDCG